jgi:glycosyltransferase involved in cell wall biosynthesis
MRKRIGFAVEQTLGNRAYFKNLKLILGGREDVDPVWLPIEERPGDLWDRMPFVAGKLSLKGGLRARSALRRAHHERRLDAALIHTQRIAHLAVDVMRRTPTVISMDGTPYELEHYVRLYDMPDQHQGWMGKAKHAINGATYRRAHRVIAFNDLTRGSLVNRYRVPAERVLVIPPGVDLRLWHPAPEKKPHDGIVRLLFVGGDWERKGGDLLLRWAKETHKQGWELHLVTGTDVECPANVYLHRGLGPNDPRLIELAQRADLLVLPSRADLSPYAIQEGKAAGLGSVVTRVGAVPELVRDGVDGFVLPPGEYGPLAERLDYLLEHPAQMREMGRRAREMAEELFDANRNSARVMDVLLSAA